MIVTIKKGVLPALIICGIILVGILDTESFHQDSILVKSPHYEDFHDIQTIEITYTAEKGSEIIYRFYKIETINGEYRSNMGNRIDNHFIDLLAESFTGFYESAYEYSYDNFYRFDFNPHFEILITRLNGKPVTIKSDSDYYSFIPWNIEYDGKTYAQYNGIIPTALFKILIEIDRETWISFDKESRWGCYQPEVPERHFEFSRDFPVAEIVNPEENGKNHMLWELNTNNSILVNPFYNDGNVFVTLEDRFISVDGETGDILWELIYEEEGVEFPYSLFPIENVVFEEGVVYVSAPDSWVYKVDSETGDPIWKYKTDTHYAFSLKIMGDNLIALTGGVTCLNKETGAKIWDITDDTWNEKFYDDKILLESFGEGPDSYHALIDSNTGEILWKENLFDVVNPVYHEGVLYYSRPKENILVSTVVKTLNENWSYAYSKTLEYFEVFDDKILLVLFDRKGFLDSLVLLNMNGSLAWNYTYSGEVEWGFGFEAESILHEGILFIVREKGVIEAFNTENGDKLWETEVRGTQITSFDIYEQRIYIAANDGNLYCLNQDTGTILWVFAAENALSMYPEDVHIYVSSIEDGFLYVATMDGTLFAVVD
ncbi:MAG: PQQ-binding-like beta-propeller repeat protein [Theionarchaea archaeon]|nr:PQQ-binding-like beta-propeller repeat protein [Theionarchaea archaeon]